MHHLSLCLCLSCCSDEAVDQSDGSSDFYINVCLPLNPIPGVNCPPGAAVCMDPDNGPPVVSFPHALKEGRRRRRSLSLLVSDHLPLSCPGHRPNHQRPRDRQRHRGGLHHLLQLHPLSGGPSAELLVHHHLHLPERPGAGQSALLSAACPAVFTLKSSEIRTGMGGG